MPEDPSTPPTPPDVRQQQQAPLTAYAKGAQKQGAQQGPGDTSMQFAMQKLGSISNDLLELAKVLAVEKPALIPILKRMAQMGKTLEQMMNSQGSQGGGNSQPSDGAEPPQGSNVAPEAPSAMGM